LKVHGQWILFFGWCKTVGFFVIAIRAMAAATFATVAAFQMMLFGKAFESFGREIKIFAFYRGSCIVLFCHAQKYKFSQEQK